MVDLRTLKGTVEPLRQKVRVPGNSEYRSEVVRTILDYVLNIKDNDNKDEINNINSVLEFSSAHPNKPTPPSIDISILKNTNIKTADVLSSLNEVANFEVFNEKDSIVLVISENSRKNKNSVQKFLQPPVEKFSKTKSAQMSLPVKQMLTSSSFRPSRLLSLTTNGSPIQGTPPSLAFTPNKQISTQNNNRNPLRNSKTSPSYISRSKTLPFLSSNRKYPVPVNLRQFLTSRPVVSVPKHTPLPLETEPSPSPIVATTNAKIQSSITRTNQTSNTKTNNRSVYWVPFIPGVPLPLLLQQIVRSRRLNTLFQAQSMERKRLNSDNSYKLRIRNRKPRKSTISENSKLPSSIQDIINGNTDTSEPLYKKANRIRFEKDNAKDEVEKEKVQNPVQLRKLQTDRWVWTG